MTDIPLDLIRANPFRDFELHPIDETQVEKLRASISRSGGLWPGVLARPIGDEYQLAFGHHRIEAARREGLETVPIEVCEMSDGQMAVFLAAENATQRGTTAAASLDAIAGLGRAVQEQCGRGDAFLLAKIFAISLTAAERIWGHIQSGGVPGEDCIREVAPKGAYTLGQIRVALRVLRDSGRLGEKSQTFDAKCARLFRHDYHLAEFRRIVTGDVVRSYLPVEEQFGFAQKIIDKIGSNELTAIKLRERANAIMYEDLGMPRHAMRNSPLRLNDDRVRDASNLMRRGAHSVKQSCRMLATLMDEGIDVDPEVIDRFKDYIAEMHQALHSLTLKPSGKRSSNLRLIVNREDVA